MARAIGMLPFGRYNAVEELIEKECPIPAEAVGIRHASLYSHSENKQAILDPSSQTTLERFETLYPKTEYVNRLMTHSRGQKVVRFYDPDGNLIEVGTPV